MKSIISILFIIIISFTSCSPSATGIFTKRTAHEAYAQKLKDAGLSETALGSLWIQAAENALRQSTSVKLPFQESGYFAAEKPSAVSYSFNAKRGEKITVRLNKRSVGTSIVYFELWSVSDDNKSLPSYLMSPENGATTLNYSPKTTGNYLLLIQPELLKSVEYNIEIITAPSLAYPLALPGNNHIKSLWGMERDKGARKHEGIDMFGPFRTPLLAVADGRVTRVENTKIGGKVIWLQPDEGNYSIYYAHLDEQLSKPGDWMKTGDILGFMGSTGNAAGGPPHLHFGIYTYGGAIDPYAFVYRRDSIPPKIVAPVNLLGDTLRLTGKPVNVTRNIDDGETLTLQNNSPVIAEGAAKNKYRIRLPDQSIGFVPATQVSSIEKPLKRIKINEEQPYFDEASESALKKGTIAKDTFVDVLAEYRDYYLVSLQNQKGWVRK